MTTIKLSFFGDARIFINGEPITPAATHLFALTFLLAQSRDRRLTRPKLQQFLFATTSRRQASHNLRQLLYRLRCLGLAFDERPTGLCLIAPCICTAGQHLSSLSEREIVELRPEDLVFLPSYAPNLPAPYLEWLDSIRDTAECEIRNLLLHNMDALRASQSWAAALHLGRLLLESDPFNERVIATVAESLAILGRRQEALSVLDAHDQEITINSRSSHLHSLRLRINRLPESKRGTVLYGRESHLLFLQRQWNTPDPGGARQVVLVGHSGVGKTRLANAFATTLSLSGANVVRYECDVHSRDQPFSLFCHILPELRNMRGSLGASPDYDAVLSRICQFASAGDAVLTSDITLGALRLQAQAALIDLLEAISAEGRVLLVLDDSHYLDDASRSVIRELTGAPNDADLVIVLCLRRSPLGHPLLDHKRCAALEVEPLSEAASVALLTNILSDQNPSDDHFSWCLEHAAGNPFYLHALANHGSRTTISPPFDVRSLAVHSYSALSSDARSVLEACLLLGRFATLQRVHAVALVSDISMLAALRALEESDLIHSIDGFLSGPHALLHDALRALIPTSIAALLHRRIAKTLQDECIQDNHAPPFALMAARSWMAAGDPQAATRLLRQCANHAYSLGEPGMAVTLLSEILEFSVPNALRATILDDLVGYAQAVGLQAKAASLLRDRYQIARDLSESPEVVNELEFRIVEADLLNGGRLECAVGPLLGLLETTTVQAAVRLRAAVRLMILADQTLDPRLAWRVHESALCFQNDAHTEDSLFIQENLIFHTSFGDVPTALTLAQTLAARFPMPSLDASITKARSFAAYAFYRLRSWNMAIKMCEDTYAFMSRHGASSHALYSASLLAEMAVTDGRLSAASLWLSKATSSAGEAAPYQVSPSSGVYYTASVLAMIEGRYEEAEAFSLAPERNFPILAAARNKAVSTALGLRIRQLRGDTESMADDLATLECLYENGKTLGGQDSIVETLWCSRILRDDVTGASSLLRDYVTRYRREISPPDWSLRFATGADEAWQCL